MGESQKWDLEQKGPDTKNVHLHEAPQKQKWNKRVTNQIGKGSEWHETAVE